MIKTFIVFIVVLFPLFSPAVELVKDGKAVSEIVIPESPLAGVKVAAEELQTYIQKISGSKLPIVNKLSADIKNQIYVGESEYTKKLGFNLDDVKDDGFKIIAEKNYLILAGKEIYFHDKVFGKFKDSRNRQKDWVEYTGQNWRFPPLYNYQSYNKECGFHLNDGTGTLYAVNEFLEQLGVRRYMPIEEIGTVIPLKKDISIKDQSVKKEPEFSQRLMEDVAVGNYKNEILWLKSMKVGRSSVMPIYHSLSGPMLNSKMNREQQPKEYYGVLGGNIDYNIPLLSSERLRADTIKYLEAVDNAFPGIDYTCIGQPDGWSNIDSRDASAGWDKFSERGQAGRFSDYAWDFIMDIRKRYMEKYPNKKFTVMAYSSTKRPPVNIDKVPDNVTVVYTQTSSQWMLPYCKDELLFREEWLKKINSKAQLLIWEYYLEQAPIRNFPPIPVIFTKNMKKNFDGLYDRSAGFTVEIPWSTPEEIKANKIVLRRPGLSHFMIYLHNKFCWDRNLDINVVMNEYYELFFGPAKSEMKEFYEFAEEVWMRPDSRQLTQNSGFLKPADVNRYFDILKRAKTKAGDSVYGKRIALIEKEMEPLNIVFDKLKRVGPKIQCFETEQKIEIDANLDKPVWRNVENSFIPMRDARTGVLPSHVATNVSFRWVTDKTLVIAVECMESKMDKIRDVAKENDSVSIFSDDFVQINIETPQGIRPFIAVNPSGIVYDSCVTAKVEDLPLFYKVSKSAVKKYQDRWTVEIQIDADSISAGRPTPFYPWGINVCRQRMAGNTPESYMLSPSGSTFKDLKYMGNLMLRK